MIRSTRWTLFVCATAICVACGEEKKPPPRRAPAAPAGKPASEPAPAEGGPAPSSPKETPEKLRRRALREEDFFEAETNRDPFRSFLDALNRPNTGAVQTDVKVKFKDYGCEELKLVAIIAGGLNPMAMFRDPKGWGETIRVSDRICRSQAKVVRIVAEAVILESEEDLGGAKTRPVQTRIPISTEVIPQLPPAAPE